MMEVILLPLLVKFSHVHQTVLHLFQTPDLFPTTPSAHLNRWFTKDCISLHTDTHTYLGCEKQMPAQTHETIIFYSRDLSVCIEVVCWDLQSDSVLRVTFQLLRDETSFLHQEVCSHDLLPQPPEASHQHYLSA